MLNTLIPYVEAENATSGPQLNYIYKYTIRWILDEKRAIMGEEKVLNVNIGKENTEWWQYSSENQRCGVLIGLNWKSAYRSAIIRITRHASLMSSPQSLDASENISLLSKIDVVDIPVCEADYLYDNHISVNGYKWKTLKKGTETVIRPINNIESVRFEGTNVICTSTKRPETGIWMIGDIVYNVGDESDSIFWIYGNNNEFIKK